MMEAAFPRRPPHYAAHSEPRSRAPAGSVSGDQGSPTPTPVETTPDDALALANIDIVGEHAGRIEECQPARSKVVVIVLDEAGEVVGEGVFAADADGPAAARLPCRVGQRPGADKKSQILVALPGAAALHIAEETVPGVADASGDGRQRADARPIGRQVDGNIVVGSGCIGPGVVALNADHEAAGELIV